MRRDKLKELLLAVEIVEEGLHDRLGSNVHNDPCPDCDYPDEGESGVIRCAHYQDTEWRDLLRSRLIAYKASVKP